MTYAIHNLHVPGIEVDEAGTATHDGTVRLEMKEPLRTAETREGTEAWRVRWIEGVSTPASTGAAA